MFLVCALAAEALTTSPHCFPQENSPLPRLSNSNLIWLLCPFMIHHKTHKGIQASFLLLFPLRLFPLAHTSKATIDNPLTFPKTLLLTPAKLLSSRDKRRRPGKLPRTKHPRVAQTLLVPHPYHYSRQCQKSLLINTQK